MGLNAVIVKHSISLFPAAGRGTSLQHYCTMPGAGLKETDGRDLPRVLQISREKCAKIIG
jgi:hypothetical protein